MSASVKSGDFSKLAVDYAMYRPDYSTTVRDLLIRHVSPPERRPEVADVGAGTGIWSRLLLEAGLRCDCVEPSAEMREMGRRHTEGAGAVTWREGSGEATGLENTSVDWVTMASSFHWVNPSEGLKEFARILRPGGFFTALWNPRNIEGDAFHEGIETMIHDMVPEMTRKSSGGRGKVADMYATLVSSGHFEDVVFVEAPHLIAMSPERYIGAWRSVNDIQAQAGPERFARILQRIGERIAGMDRIVVPYLTRSWTARLRRPA